MCNNDFTKLESKPMRDGLSGVLHSTECEQLYLILQTSVLNGFRFLYIKLLSRYLIVMTKSKMLHVIIIDYIIHFETLYSI